MKFINKVVINDVTKLDLTSDTITADKLLKGITAHDSTGAPIVGVYEPTDTPLGGDYNITSKTNGDGTQTLHIVDAQDCVDNYTWYPSDTALLFKHFKDGAPDINTVKFTDSFTDVSDKFGGSIIPYECRCQINLKNYIGNEGTIAFDYALNGTSANLQRLLTLQWDTYENCHVYVLANSLDPKQTSKTSTSEVITSKGTCIITFNTTSVDFYFYKSDTNSGYDVINIDISQVIGSITRAAIGADGASRPSSWFNGCVWNVAYIPRVINDDEIQKIFGK